MENEKFFNRFNFVQTFQFCINFPKSRRTYNLTNDKPYNVWRNYIKYEIIIRDEERVRVCVKSSNEKRAHRYLTCRLALTWYHLHKRAHI